MSQAVKHGPEFIFGKADALGKIIGSGALGDCSARAGQASRMHREHVQERQKISSRIRRDRCLVL